MNRFETKKTISQTVCTDEQTMEQWDRLSRLLGVSHSQLARMAIRNLASQWHIDQHPTATRD